MSWLTPLGFLGLIGLIILIIIYIIKPNYQNKIISSTFLWKLSLKYKKKKIPISKLRNILLFICQTLIITSIAFILAQPFLAVEKEEETPEKIIIIDASASMLTSSDGVTRFEKAVDHVRNLANETFDKEGKITVILASETASFVLQNIGAEYRNTAIQAIDLLTDPNQPSPCSYGKGDLEGAMALAEEITAVKPGVQVLLYTDATYIDDGNVTVVDVKEIGEWNAAILDVRAIVDENYYRFEIDVACYGGVDRDLTVQCEIIDANGLDNIDLVATARCYADEVVTLVYGNFDSDHPDDTILEDVEVYTFSHINVTLPESDSFEYDNSYYLYGGKKLPLRVQYYSANPNNYFATALMVLRDKLNKRWDVEYVEVNGGTNEEIEPATEGFDVYIYEHRIPKTLPNDGVVILVNPDYIPATAGLRIGKVYGNGTTSIALDAGDDHPLMKSIDPSRIEVSMYTQITSYDGYTPLMFANNVPVVMAKNEPDQKIVIMSFSLNFSNFAMMPEFPLLMDNIFEYYIPSTVTEYVFEVNEALALNARSESVTVVGPSVEMEITEFPGTVNLKRPGVYTVSQTPISGEEVVENLYVKVPAAESNIAPVEDTLTNPYFIEAEDEADMDLLLYLALTLVILLLAEWWLHNREQI